MYEGCSSHPPLERANLRTGERKLWNLASKPLTLSRGPFLAWRPVLDFSASTELGAAGIVWGNHKNAPLRFPSHAEFGFCLVPDTTQEQNLEEGKNTQHYFKCCGENLYFIIEFYLVCLKKKKRASLTFPWIKKQLRSRATKHTTPYFLPYLLMLVTHKHRATENFASSVKTLLRTNLGAGVQLLIRLLV